MKKCKQGYYYCYTDEKCKPIPQGLKMTARFSGGGREPEETGIDAPTNGNNQNGNGNGNGNGKKVKCNHLLVVAVGLSIPIFTMGDVDMPRRGSLCFNLNRVKKKKKKKGK